MGTDFTVRKSAEVTSAQPPQLPQMGRKPAEILAEVTLRRSAEVCGGCFSNPQKTVRKSAEVLRRFTLPLRGRFAVGGDLPLGGAGA